MTTPNGTRLDDGPRRQAPRAATSFVPAAGEVIAARYRLEKLLGRGGMGVVFEAVHEEIGKRAAIKVLRPTGRAGDAAARLVREAQALAKLAHPNVVTVHDLHATMLYQLGIQHDAFSFKFQGLDAKLTGVERAKVIKTILT